MKQTKRVDLAEVERRVTVLEGAVSGRIPRLEKTALRHSKSLSMLVPESAIESLTAFEGRLKELSERLQVMILRFAVCTEVSRFDVTIWPYIVAALDEGDDWWRDGDGLTIGQWAARLRDKFPEALHRITPP